MSCDTAGLAEDIRPNGPDWLRSASARVSSRGFFVPFRVPPAVIMRRNVR